MISASRISNVLAQVREMAANDVISASGRVEADALRMYSAPFAKISCEPASYSTDGANMPRRRGAGAPGGGGGGGGGGRLSWFSSSSRPILPTSDIPPNAYSIPPHLRDIRYSIPFPHVGPMSAGGLSTARIYSFQSSLKTESMAIEAHCHSTSTGSSSYFFPTLEEDEEEGEVVDADENSDTKTTGTTPSVSHPLSSQQSSGSRRNKKKNATSSYADFENSFKSYFGGQSSSGSRTRESSSTSTTTNTIASHLQPELYPGVMVFPSGEAGAKAAVEFETASPNNTWKGSSSSNKTRRNTTRQGSGGGGGTGGGGPSEMQSVLNRYAAAQEYLYSNGERDYTVADVETFRAHYDSVGDVSAHEGWKKGQLAFTTYDSHTATKTSDYLVHSVVGVSTHGQSQQQKSRSKTGEKAAVVVDAPGIKPGFSVESAALLSSLAAFRYGLQEIEHHRRRRNAVLNRDPYQDMVEVGGSAEDSSALVSQTPPFLHKRG